MGVCCYYSRTETGISRNRNNIVNATQSFSNLSEREGTPSRTPQKYDFIWYSLLFQPKTPRKNESAFNCPWKRFQWRTKTPSSGPEGTFIFLLPREENNSGCTPSVYPKFMIERYCFIKIWIEGSGLNKCKKCSPQSLFRTAHGHASHRWSCQPPQYLRPQNIHGQPVHCRSCSPSDANAQSDGSSTWRFSNPNQRCSTSGCCQSTSCPSHSNVWHSERERHPPDSPDSSWYHYPIFMLQYYRGLTVFLQMLYRILKLFR